MNSWLKKAGNWLGSDSIGQSLGFSSGISNADLLLGADQLGGQLAGILAGQNETTVGNLMKNIPGLSTVGNLINAAFGSYINDEFVTQTRYATNALGNRTFNFNTNADVLNDWKNYSDLSLVRQSDVGSDGWFSSDAEDTTDDLNAGIRSANKRQRANFYLSAQNADQNTDFRILQGMQAAYGGPINSFRKYYSKGGYLNQAKALIRQNEGWREKPYADAPRGKNWRSVGYGFNDSGFREKYPEGISKHYEHGITKKQAEEELDYFLSKAEKQLKSIYGKQWNEFTDSQKAAILDTYYQRPASVGKSSRFYKAVTSGEDAGRYLGVAGFDKRNKIRRGVFGGSQDYVNLGAETENLSTNSSSLQEVTPFTPVVHDLDLSGITPTQAKALELNLTSPTFDLSMFGSVPTQQESYVPTVGTIEDFLASYGDFEENLFKKGGSIHIKPSHRGRLTALKKRTGKSEAELYRTGGPAVRKMITFARNARKWKHEDGGELNIKDMDIFDFGGGLTHKVDAEGGWLSHTHGSDFDSGINWVGEGKSHEQNPLGGVPMGVDERGIPNLVEEGEAIWNGDYVFSKRMKVPKKLREKYSLPDDATFADAVAKITKPSEERPLSSIDIATNDQILGEFADTQEEMRMAKAQRAMDKEIQLQDDFLTGFQFGLGGHMSPMGIVPDSDNISLFDKLENSFADGGGIHIDPSKKGTFKAQASKMGMLFDNPFGEANTFDFGGDLKRRRDSIMRNNGVTEEQANAMLFRMLSKEDRGRAIRERVFGTWTPTYNSNNEIVVPTSTTSQSTGNSKTASQKSGTKSKATSSVATNPKGATGLNLYDWYRNGSDGISEPKGFKVGQDGKAYDYTQEYKDLVDSLGADDVRKWAAEHPDDPSLKSFLAKGNDLSKLTDDQWRTGATDGKYGFMHHVADQINKEQSAPTTIPADFNWRQETPWLFGTIPTVAQEQVRPMEQIAKDKSTGTRTVSATDNGTNFMVTETPQSTTRSGITDVAPIAGTSPKNRKQIAPKQTWMRNLPWMMSGIFGLNEMLTPADYSNADAITKAAYEVGTPVSIGTEYIGDYRKRDPFDERYLENIINQRGTTTNRNFMNLSGGNRAVEMSGILANDLTTQMSLAEAARQAYLANREDDAKVTEFNRGTNLFNAQTQNQRNQFLAQLNSQRQQAMLSGVAQGARMRQAIKDQRDAAISANWTAFAQGLGDIGWENYQTNQVNSLYNQGYTPYWINMTGNTNFGGRYNG